MIILLLALPNVNPRGSNVLKHMLNGETMATALRAAGKNHEAGLLETCGENYSQVRTCLKDFDHYKRPIRHTCQQRYCPDCNYWSAVTVAEECLDIALRAAWDRSNTSLLKFVTLTTAISVLEADANARLRRAFLAAVRAIERAHFLVLKDTLPHAEKRNGRLSKTAHPDLGYVIGADVGGQGLKAHFHTVVSGPYLPCDLLREEWKRQTDWEAQGVDIEFIPPKPEVVKAKFVYALQLKASDMPPQYAPQLVDLFKGINRTRRTGMFLGTTGTTKRPAPICTECGRKTHVLPRGLYERLTDDPRCACSYGRVQETECQSWHDTRGRCE